jgi:dCTP deaminase
MILSDKTIMKMLKEKTLTIEPVTDEQIQLASVDIRLGNSFSVVDDSPSSVITLEKRSIIKP